jgi:hypothetical protein
MIWCAYFNHAQGEPIPSVLKPLFWTGSYVIESGVAARAVEIVYAFGVIVMLLAVLRVFSPGFGVLRGR